MLRKNNGVTLTILIVTVIVILILASVSITTSQVLIRDTKSRAIISNMYLIRAKVEAMYEEYEFSGDSDILIEENHIKGDDLSTLLQTEKYHIEQNPNFNDFWYSWDKNTLKSLGFDESMLPKNGEFIVNYKIPEVIYTPGIKDESNETKYKLSDFEKKE